MFNNQLEPQAYLFPEFSRKSDGISILQSRQYESALSVAKKCNLPINEDLLLLDSGKSVHNKMGKLGMFLHAVEEGKVASGSVLVIESLDQLRCESVSSAMELFNRLIKNEITIITTIDGKTYNKIEITQRPEFLFSVLAKMHRANEESLRKRTRLAEHLRFKIQRYGKGEHTKFFTKVPHWISDTDKGFALNHHVKAIEMIITMYLDNKGLKNIVQELTKMGIKSPTGKKIWGESTIRSILKNPALYGLKKFNLSSTRYDVSNREIYEIENFYEPLITKEEFLVMQERKKKKVNNRVSRN